MGTVFKECERETIDGKIVKSIWREVNSDELSLSKRKYNYDGKCSHELLMDSKDFNNYVECAICGMPMCSMKGR